MGAAGSARELAARTGGGRRRPARAWGRRRRASVPRAGRAPRGAIGACATRAALRVLPLRPMSQSPVQILHVFPTFAPGGAQVRATDLIQAFGPDWKHAVVALDGVFGARERVRAPIELELVEAPPKAGSLATARWLRGLLARRKPDLVLTYNFGAIDALLAARTLRGVRLVHHEDGFGSDEARALKRRRNWLRRAAFPAAARVVVISRNLERIALEAWRQPQARVAYIPNGIDVERFARGLGAPELRHQLRIPARA